MSRLRIKPKKSERISLYEAVREVMKRLNVSEAEAKRRLQEAMQSGQLTAFGRRASGKIEPVPPEYWQQSKPRQQ